MWFGLAWLPAVCENESFGDPNGVNLLCGLSFALKTTVFVNTRSNKSEMKLSQ